MLYVQASNSSRNSDESREYILPSKAQLRMSSVSRSSDAGRERVNDVKEGIQVVELTEGVLYALD